MTDTTHRPITPATAGTDPWRALPVLLAGAFMVVLDFFIVNVALPSIATELGAGSGSLEWIVAGYGLSFAAFLITAGRLGDDLGRRRMYALGLALFTATSALCGIAPTPATLVAARILQGVAGALVMPQVLSTIGVTFRGADYHRALSAYGVVLGLAAVGGQVIGGALVQSDLAGLGWRSCFLINVPIGLVALVLTPRMVRESRSEHRVRLDVRGAVMLAAGLTAILLPLIEGRPLGWPAWTWALLAVAPVILAVFVLRQRDLGRTGRDPLLDLTLFRERGFSAGMATQLLLAGAQASFFVFLALYLQDGRGMGPLDAGLVFTVLAAAYVVASGPAPALTARFGRTVVAAGGAALTAGLVALAATVAEIGTGGSVAALVPGLLLVGAGIGLCYTPLTSIVLANVDPAGAGGAAGAMSTTQQVGYALGVAVTGVIFFGAQSQGIARAFELSLVELSVLAAAIVLTSRFLPARRAPAGARSRSAVAPARG